MFMTIHQWKNPEIIFQLAVICGVPRNDDDISHLQKQSDYLHSLGAKTKILDMNIITVSSTQIRNNVSHNKSISGMVNPDIENYIIKNNLYK